MNKEDNKQYQEVNQTSMSEDASPDKNQDTNATEGSEMANLDLAKKSDKENKLVIKFKLMQGSERQVEITKK